MSYYAYKLQNLQMKEATFYAVDITKFDSYDFTKWFVKARQLIFCLLLGGGMCYILSAIAFYLWGDIRVLAIACASFVETIIIYNGMARLMIFTRKIETTIRECVWMTNQHDLV